MSSRLAVLLAVLVGASAAAQTAPDAEAGGAAWVEAWAVAERRGDEAAAARALDRLAAPGVWRPAALAFARWTLRHAPPDAVLLTNGGVATAPVVIAQRAEGLRPDVAVVDVTLLDDPAAARRVAAAHGLPLPDAVDAFRPRLDPRGSTATPEGRRYTLRDAVLDRWLADAASGALGRPLVAAITLDPEVLGAKTDVVDRAAHLAPADSFGFDAEAARAAVATLDGAAFAGPPGSLAVPGPDGPALPFDAAGVVLFQALQTAVALAQGGDAAGAEAVYAQAVAFAEAAGRADDPLVAVARQWIDDAAGAP